MEFVLGLLSAVAAGLIVAAVVATVRLLLRKLNPASPESALPALAAAEGHLVALRDQLSSLSISRAQKALEISNLEATLAQIDREIEFIQNEMRRISENVGRPERQGGEDSYDA